MTPASTTRRPCMPRTRSLESTTAVVPHSKYLVNPGNVDPDMAG